MERDMWASWRNGMLIRILLRLNWVEGKSIGQFHQVTTNRADDDCIRPSRSINTSACQALGHAPLHYGVKCTQCIIGHKGNISTSLGSKCIRWSCIMGGGIRWISMWHNSRVQWRADFFFRWTSEEKNRVNFASWRPNESPWDHQNGILQGILCM